MNWRRLMCSPQPRITPYHIVEKAVLCIAAFWPPRLPQRVDRLHYRSATLGTARAVSRHYGRPIVRQPSISYTRVHVIASPRPAGWVHCAVPPHQCSAAALWRAMAARNQSTDGFAAHRAQGRHAIAATVSRPEVIPFRAARPDIGGIASYFTRNSSIAANSNRNLTANIPRRFMSSMKRSESFLSPLRSGEKASMAFWRSPIDFQSSSALCSI